MRLYKIACTIRIPGAGTVNFQSIMQMADNPKTAERAFRKSIRENYPPKTQIDNLVLEDRGEVGK